MERAVKHLREGRVTDGAVAPLTILRDTLRPVGGRDVMLQLYQALLVAVKANRAQAKHMCLVMVEKGPSEYAALGEQVVTCIDARMHAWDNMNQKTSSRREPSGEDPKTCVFANDMESLEAHLMGSVSDPCQLKETSFNKPVAIVIDSLSHLLMQYSTQKVYSLLTRLQDHPGVSCIMGLIHKDLHDEHVISGIEHMSTCYIDLQALGQLQQDVATCNAGVAPHGCISFRYKRRAGRVHAEPLLYTLIETGAIIITAPPAVLTSVITAESLVAANYKHGLGQGQNAAPNNASSAAPVAESSNVVGPIWKGAPGGMRMDLTEKERQAKELVRLPYVHQGQSKEYQTGDFRDYLPSPAGGHAGSRHVQDIAEAEQHVAKLGHILYIRDSEEEHDSDEDPDDDLDI